VYPALVGIVVYFMLKELMRPAISYQLNRRFNAQNRATYLSFYNLICSVGEVAAGIAAGFLAAGLGIKIIFIIAITIIPVIGLFFVIIKGVRSRP
jgi:MFS family permease